ncbi:GL25619 [Drosophila persimilis]|uniref:GL25619 n=1 Tax=Drosophila persimilis TaxID=7234 RepID=B4GKW5_DROPE|nr:GTPase-activating protein CdGAPr [Drosophila persimilis]XP_026842930.1 GTPase-activating protein CdGAPr [Drosophila persimilis]EDW37281.1 GL25619 [Drosophila persimilis]
MSEKVSASLASQLHSHALATTDGSGAAAGCHHPTTKDAHPPLQFEMDAPAAAISAQLNFKIMPADSLPGLSYQEMFASMNTSQISNASTEASSSCSPQLGLGLGLGLGVPMGPPPPKPSRQHMAVQPLTTSKSCRFPKLEECAHFHYERVQLGPLSVQLLDDKSEHMGSSIASQSIGGDLPHSSLRSFSPESCWFIIRVCPQRCEPFLIKRSFENMQLLDEMLHRCVYDRKISGLRNMAELAEELPSETDVEYAVGKYLERFSKIASDSLTCGTILTWLQLDNKGRRLPLADGETQRTINTPAVGAAYGVRRYQAQAPDEINIEVGDMISVIDMPSPAESIWWRGKKSHLQKSLYEVGFFPQSCVATIGDKVPRNFPMPAPLVGHLDASPTKPVLRKHGKLIAFFRSFILSRPSRRRLKQSGIYRERVFNCDLSEHLLNSGQDIPMVLRSCAEFIENYGVIDGIYRLSGITSNIQRLRRAFDEERVPDLGNPEMKQDIHAVSSLLKMYFRELPNPLCTYQLYDNFVEAIQVKADEADERLRLMKETVLKLPPPHYRTLKYLAEHLYKVSQHHERTGMTDKNLAIVWAPNLLRSPALESGGVAALRGVGVQAVVTEYLIRNCHNIFDALEDQRHSVLPVAVALNPSERVELRLESLTDCESLLVEQREQDQSLGMVERPKSLSTGGAKLISLEEAQERHSRIEGGDLKHSLPISMLASSCSSTTNAAAAAGNAATNIGSYIEVGGGPSSLPDKYHTVLSAPRSWQKRKPDKTPSWKSIFTRSQRQGNVDPSHKITIEAGGGKLDPVSSRVSFVQASHAHASKELSKHDKPKSIELLETTHEREPKPMELCIRSNSIDSLRTVGHSRSVSHDSYFDLLQSPQRGHVTTCPSRELSELGLNFDREEPEMRIFSESESLVSSPRVGKENVPPASGCATRRIMRARPEEFSSQTNSVNPSPKKQPRLNLLSPSSARALPLPLPATAVAAAAQPGPQHHCGHEPAGAENCCKRYKLEDQLCDIQFIDCGTPEHAPTVQQQFASVEVHPPPKPARSHAPGPTSPASARYSYPSVQLGAKRKEQQAAKERFSYQGTFMQQGGKPEQTPRPAVHNNTVPMRTKPRVELPPDATDSQGKLSVATPTTPQRSPRYSLLLCDTEESSENSSAVTTPQYDMEPLMRTSAMSGISGVSSNMQQQLLMGGGSSHESLGQHFNNHQDMDQRDMNALKRELSLDLQPVQPRLPQPANRAATLPVKEQLQAAAAAASPNNSNFTDNTSQSVTPSEYGYQHLQRHLSMHSLLATEESSPVYEDFEQTPSNGLHKLVAATSPIKSTISITYKSPEKEKPQQKLLETNFDENIVYEQVKLFRNSVTEVNQMMLRDQETRPPCLKQIEEEEHDVCASKAEEMTEQLLQLEKEQQQQQQQQLLEHQELTEDDEQESQLLYENIELRKPKTVYENLRGEEMKLILEPDLKPVVNSDRIELDSLDSLPDNMEQEHELPTELHLAPMPAMPVSKSPSFSVKELANKFESSPVEQLPSFDFSVRGGSMKKPNELSVPLSMPKAMPAPVPLKKLNNAQKITRSLDENAFVREFGGKQLQDLSLSKLPELPEMNNRRKSFDFTRPKTLNPPKRLPGMSITEEICQKRGSGGGGEPEPIAITPTTENRISLIQNNVPKDQPASATPFPPPVGRKSVVAGVILDRERIEKIKEERRQQLTQKYHGDTLKSRSKTELNSTDDSNFPATESLRIKSKSRGDMHSLQKDMDMNLKQLARVPGGGSESTLHTVPSDYVGQGNGQQGQQQQRVRSISDEKNQNCDTNSGGGVAGGGGVGTTLLSVKTAAQKYGNQKAAPSSSASIASSSSSSSGLVRGPPPQPLPRERMPQRNSLAAESNASANNREKISPQFSIRDVTAMFESRSQNQ